MTDDLTKHGTDPHWTQREIAKADNLSRKPEQDFTDWHDDYAPGYKLTAFALIVALLIGAAASAWVF